MVRFTSLLLVTAVGASTTPSFLKDNNKIIQNNNNKVTTTRRSSPHMNRLHKSLLHKGLQNKIHNTHHQHSRRRLEDDMSWMNGYAVMYENCFLSDNVATFRLCPEDDRCEASCDGGAEYVLDLPSFVDAFTEAQMGAVEYKCEMVRENCEEDDDNVCYENAGYDDCQDKNEDDNGFNLQEYLACVQINEDDEDGEDGDGDNAAVYVGPYCSDDNYNIYLGVFSDDACTVQLSDSYWYDIYGYELPYNSTAIITNECASCREHGAEEDQNGGDDAEDEDDVIEQCEELYNNGAGCESNLEDKEDPDESACDYIAQLQSNEAVTSGEPTSNAKSSRSGVGKTSKILLIVFLAAALLVGCCGCGYCMYARKKKSDGSKPSNQSLI